MGELKAELRIDAKDWAEERTRDLMDEACLPVSIATVDGALRQSIASALREAERRGAEAERAELRGILKFDFEETVTDEEGGHVVSYDPVLNLEGALCDMRRTGKADAVVIETVARVQSRLADFEKATRKP